MTRMTSKAKDAPADVPVVVQEAPDRPWTEEELTHVDPETGAWAPALKQHWPELGYKPEPESAPEAPLEVTDNA